MTILIYFLTPMFLITEATFWMIPYQVSGLAPNGFDDEGLEPKEDYAYDEHNEFLHLHNGEDDYEDAKKGSESNKNEKKMGSLTDNNNEEEESFKEMPKPNFRL